MRFRAAPSLRSASLSAFLRSPKPILFFNDQLCTFQLKWVCTFQVKSTIRLKKLESGVESFRFPIALAALLSAIFNRLLPFGIRLESTLPPLILLFGASLSQLAKCLADENCRIPSNPTSLINDSIVEWLNPSIAIRSTPSKY